MKTLGPRVAAFIGWGLAVAEAALDGPREVAVVGAGDDPLTKELHRVALLSGAPGAVVAAGEVGSDEFPLLADRGPGAYVCRHFVCDAPTSDPGELRERMGEASR